MELHVTAQRGLPADCVLSVRSGTVRRQAPIASGKAFKFPAPLSNPMKFDLLAPVASGHLVMRPGEQQYRVDFTEGGGMSCDITLKDSATTGDSSQPVVDESSKKNTASEAKEYLEKHQILEFVQAVLHTVITEKPKDPYTEMARHFMCGYRPQTEKNAAESCVQQTPANAKASETPTPMPKEQDKQVETLEPQKANLATESMQVTSAASRDESVEAEDLRVKLKDMLLSAHDTGELKTHLESVVLNGSGAKADDAAKEKLRSEIKGSVLDAYEAGTLEAALSSIK
mmetsp:Transcript_101231/g.158113  ORF Transcript_101231/g.158113 Transcript_101231/m.158113 type:complete len:286 (-) Transcript_101231:46-903(-)